ncbi:MAG TPA: hypothetical protein VGD56_02390, partial [Gemmatirosa sp.]
RPTPGPGQSTQQPRTPRKREAKKAKAKRANVPHYPVRDWAAAGKDEPCAPAIVAATPRSLRAAATENVPRLLAASREAGLSVDQTAYVLATVQGESGFGREMLERSPKDYSGRADLGNTGASDGMRYAGHGLAQLTGRSNYEKWGNILGVDLLNHPELASDPDRGTTIAVFGMRDGQFTGAALDRFVNAEQVDYHNARRVVNGFNIDPTTGRDENADAMERYANKYRSILHGCPGAPGAQSSPPGR